MVLTLLGPSWLMESTAYARMEVSSHCLVPSHPAYYVDPTTVPSLYFSLLVWQVEVKSLIHLASALGMETLVVT